jgi:hypothetical protein
MVGEAILQVDACQRRGKLVQIGRWRADQCCELAETPMRWRDRLLGAGQDQVEPFGIVAAGLTRTAALSTVRVRLRSARPFTEAISPSSDM